VGPTVKDAKEFVPLVGQELLRIPNTAQPEQNRELLGSPYPVERDRDCRPNDLRGTRIDSQIWAVRALRTETLGFRFKYPIDIDAAAGPQDSLHYYIYSDSLSWTALRLDAQGIAQCVSPTTGTVYRPAFVAWYGLINLGHYLRRQNQLNLRIFLNQVDWLERNAILREDGALVWPHTFDWKEGYTFLKAPWVSANAQGLVISALVRGWRFTRRPQLLELLKASARIFEIEVAQGGLREVVNGNLVYTELQGRAILDHFLTALLGLYDLFAETGDDIVGKMFTQGIEGLKAMLPTWDYRHKWSWYGSHGYLCPPSYHCCNRVLLTVLARLSTEPLLADYAESWNPDNLSTAARLEVFLGFLFTKNARRFKNKTWRLKRMEAKDISL
jgi:heparosan-N-sulfate-glucuronate 5-epimerase